MDGISNIFKGKVMGSENIHTSEENIQELNVVKKIKAIEQGHIKNLSDNHKMKMFAITERMKGFNSVKPKNSFQPATEKLYAMGIINRNENYMNPTNMKNYKMQEKMQSMTAKTKFENLGIFPKAQNTKRIQFSELMPMGQKNINMPKAQNIQNMTGAVFNQEINSWKTIGQRRKLNPFEDSDNDGVKNFLDCQPLNKKKKGFLHDTVLSPGTNKLLALDAITTHPFSSDDAYNARIKLINLGVIPHVEREHKYEQAGIFNEELNSWKTMGERKQYKKVYDVSSIPGLKRLGNPERGSVFNQELEMWNTMGQRRKLDTFADSDKDGVPNWMDCKPLDRKRQDYLDENRINRNPVTQEASPLPDTQYDTTVSYNVPASVEAPKINYVNTSSTNYPNTDIITPIVNAATKAKDWIGNLGGYKSEYAETPQQGESLADIELQKRFPEPNKPSTLRTAYEKVSEYVPGGLIGTQAYKNAQERNKSWDEAKRLAVLKGIEQGKIGSAEQVENVRSGKRKQQTSRVVTVDRYGNIIDNRQSGIREFSNATSMGAYDMQRGFDAAVNPMAKLRIRELTGIGGSPYNIMGIMSLDRTSTPLYAKMKQWKGVSDNVVETALEQRGVQARQIQAPITQQFYTEPAPQYSQPPVQYSQPVQAAQTGKVYSQRSKRYVAYTRPRAYEKHTPQVIQQSY